MKITKAIIGIMLLLAICNLPYAYYSLLRWIVFGASAYISYGYFEKVRKAWAWVFVLIALIFNPLFPFYMAKESWVIFDMLCGVIFLASVICDSLNAKK